MGVSVYLRAWWGIPYNLVLGWRITTQKGQGMKKRSKKEAMKCKMFGHSEETAKI